jgi:transposase
MRTSPSIVPHGADQDTYLVLDDFGRIGCAWRETNVDGADRETLIRDLVEGQYSKPVRIVAFIRGFNPKMKKAAQRLEDLRTPEDEPIPPNTLAELRRDMERRRLISEQIRQIENARLERIEHAPRHGPHAMVRVLARVIGVGIETADMLVQEVLSRNMRDRRAVARYAGLTGSPDESGTRRREKGLARSGNARVRRGMIQLAWRFLMFQKDSALARWFRARTENARGARKTMIVALARKLLIALWRLVREGVVPDGVVLRPGVMNGGR